MDHCPKKRAISRRVARMSAAKSGATRHEEAIACCEAPPLSHSDPQRTRIEKRPRLSLCSSRATSDWLVVIMVLLAGLSGLVTALGTFFVNPVAGALVLIASFAGMLVGILFARIVAEFILMVFRINERLAAIRNREV